MAANFLGKHVYFASQYSPLAAFIKAAKASAAPYGGLRLKRAAGVPVVLHRRWFGSQAQRQGMTLASAVRRLVADA